MKNSVRLAVLTLALSLWCPGSDRAADQSPAAPAGSLRVKSDVSDVLVLLDDKEVGRTPLTLRTLALGSHRLTLVKEGYEDHAQQVEVTAGQPASVFVVMKPLPTALPELPVEFKVMHQHRFGYCVGRLTVGAEALEYQDDKGEDKFHIPIQTLKSVSRSWGPVPGMAPGGVNAQTDMMAFRIEAPGRAYGFLAYKEQIGEQMSVAAEKTKELFELVYKLWTATLKAKDR